MGNLDQNREPKKLLTIGGWDPCGAFGVPADIKTFAALGGYGMAVMTVVTAQNSVGWYGAEFMSADFVAQQLDAVLGDYGADGVKTGFLGRADLIEVIGQKLAEYEVRNIVVDPVLINANGRPMFGPDVQAAYERHLFPLATAITPNRTELNWLLTGESRRWELTDASLEQLFNWITTQKLKAGVVAKGLPVESGLADALILEQQIMYHEHDQIETKNVSGTGDSFSAALTSYLAAGDTLRQAFERASAGVTQAIEGAADWRLGTGPGPIAHKEFGRSS